MHALYGQILYDQLQVLELLQMVPSLGLGKRQIYIRQINLANNRLDTNVKLYRFFFFCVFNKVKIINKYFKHTATFAKWQEFVFNSSDNYNIRFC